MKAYHIYCAPLLCRIAIPSALCTPFQLFVKDTACLLVVNVIACFKLSFVILPLSPVLGECGLLPSPFPPRRVCLILRDCREVLGEGSVLVLGALDPTQRHKYDILVHSIILCVT